MSEKFFTKAQNVNIKVVLTWFGGDKNTTPTSSSLPQAAKRQFLVVYFTVDFMKGFLKF